MSDPFGQVIPPVGVGGNPTRVWEAEVVTVNAGTVTCQNMNSRTQRHEVPTPYFYTPTIGDRVLLTDLDGDKRKPGVVAVRIGAILGADVPTVVGTPTDADHATTKSYVDALLAASAAKSGTVPTAQVLEPGLVGQVRAGRKLTVADFTTLLGVAEPLGLWQLDGDANDSSSNARHMGNTTGGTTVPSYVTGLLGAANEAVTFAVTTPKALGIADAAWQGPQALTAGFWMRAAGTGPIMTPLGKEFSWKFQVTAAGNIGGYLSTNGTSWALNTMFSQSVITDDRWHFVAMTFDGAVVKLLIDGRVEAGAFITAPLVRSTKPLNIGCYQATDLTSTPQEVCSTARLSNAFLLDEVLTEDQCRVLMAAVMPHGLTVTPQDATVSVTRRRRGGPLAMTDFPSWSSSGRLFNFTGAAGSTGKRDDEYDLANATSGYRLTENNSPLSVPGPDGQRNGAYLLNGTNQYLSGPTTGLPNGSTARSYGIWFNASKYDIAAAQLLLSQGVSAFRAIHMFINAGGVVGWYAGSDAAVTVQTPGNVQDGQWHFVVAVLDTTPLPRKLYLDGKLVSANATALTTPYTDSPLTVGVRSNTNDGFFAGAVGTVFVTPSALTGEDIAKLWAIGSQPLPASPKDASAHVEAIDATNLYVLHDGLASTEQVAYRVRRT